MLFRSQTPGSWLSVHLEHHAPLLNHPQSRCESDTRKYTDALQADSRRSHSVLHGDDLDVRERSISRLCIPYVLILAVSASLEHARLQALCARASSSSSLSSICVRPLSSLRYPIRPCPPFCLVQSLRNFSPRPDPLLQRRPLEYPPDSHAVDMARARCSSG